MGLLTLPVLRIHFLIDRNLKNLSLTGGQKSLKKEIACAMWPVVFSGGRFEHLDAWCEFVMAQAINYVLRDTWMLLLDFAALDVARQPFRGALSRISSTRVGTRTLRDPRLLQIRPQRLVLAALAHELESSSLSLRPLCDSPTGHGLRRGRRVAVHHRRLRGPPESGQGGGEEVRRARVSGTPRPVSTLSSCTKWYTCARK